MVTKLVTWGDILVRDTIRIDIHSSPQVVLEITEYTAPMGSQWREVVLEGDTVRVTPNGTRCPSVHSPVLLVRRPWPIEGRRALFLDIQNAIRAVTGCAPGPIRNLAALPLLRKAIEAYELDKPLDEAQGKPLEPEKK